MAEVTHQVRATHERVALIIIDLDHFKRVNDTLGHRAGDDMLIAAAERLADAADGLPVYRFGGEEFVVLSAGADECAARALAERLRAAVASASVAGIDLTASFGIAVSAPDDGFEYRDAFARADAALYTAKSAGRDRVCVAGDAARQTRSARRRPGSGRGAGRRLGGRRRATRATAAGSSAMP